MRVHIVKRVPCSLLQKCGLYVGAIFIALLLRGVLLLFILFALVPLVLAIAPVPMISDLIEQSRLAPVFDSQLILSILRGAL